jgi:hypothetical protein
MKQTKLSEKLERILEHKHSRNFCKKELGIFLVNVGLVYMGILVVRRLTKI